MFDALQKDLPPSQNRTGRQHTGFKFQVLHLVGSLGGIKLNPLYLSHHSFKSKINTEN